VHGDNKVRFSLTSDEVFILHGGHVGLQAGEAEELSPGDARLVDVGALPVIETTPRGQHQDPVVSIIPQGLHQRRHADVDVPPQVEALRWVHVVQQIPDHTRYGQMMRNVATDWLRVEM